MTFSLVPKGKGGKPVKVVPLRHLFPAPMTKVSYHLHRLYRLSLAAYSEMSVDGRQDTLHLGMLKHILPQKVVMPTAQLGKVVPLAER